MTQGPFGGPRPFASDNKTVIILLGIDGSEPPRSVLIENQDFMNRQINKILIEANQIDNIDRDTVNLTTTGSPTSKQKMELGRAAIHLQQYDVNLPVEEVTREIINATHNTVVEEVQGLGYTVTGTETTVA